MKNRVCIAFLSDHTVLHKFTDFLKGSACSEKGLSMGPNLTAYFGD